MRAGIRAVLLLFFILCAAYSAAAQTMQMPKPKKRVNNLNQPGNKPMLSSASRISEDGVVAAAGADLSL